MLEDSKHGYLQDKEKKKANQSSSAYKADPLGNEWSCVWS